ncbi:zinc finger MYM-type protein 1-like [Chelonoidis abingdonii]|uniref:zinc finger MYM-type protein 1-like n=1 Tax=Chelonoidis abingdonii TaxID=106734 RepID=UPI0013F1C474|nr:zinc finger MYM-type protein 1-like [Chelonoidis abingdonii]
MSKKGGWQKLKEAKERRQRQDVVLKSTPSLLMFFPPTKSGGEEVQANTSPNEPAASAPDEKEKPPVTSLGAVSPHSSEDLPSDSNTKISFSNDPERGLPFHGSDETVGLKHNGNYLGVLVLIPKFDSFLAQHINEHMNSGKGHTSHLSKAICDEFIALLARKMLSAIVEEIKDVGYFSVSVDSTADVSHVDQLTVILHYMLPSRSAEHFMTFINITSHTGEKLASYLLNFLPENGIDISLCHGQNYDNASNMSGKYSGIQAKIKESNPLVDYIPCAAHSLNLVGQSAVYCCVEAVSFFGFVQEFYHFFSASTSRWMILRDSLPKGCPVPKSLSETQWSANSETANAVILGYPNILEVQQQEKMRRFRMMQCTLCKLVFCVRAGMIYFSCTSRMLGYPRITALDRGL